MLLDKTHCTFAHFGGKGILFLHSFILSGNEASSNPVRFNILSAQSTRESETWKDYRLELLEEIIKEGRKFGTFVTIASQRPADISPTIVSQLHNFFIHRLVNDRDLFLIDNTISTLDAVSRSLIPGLSQGCCVVTGTAFELPMVIQVDRLPSGKQPASEDVDLDKLWSAAQAVGAV